MQAVFTDLGNVLVTFKDRKSWLERIMECFNGNPAAVGEFLSAGSGEDVMRKLDRGEVTFTQLHAWLEKAGLSLSYDRFVGLFLRHLRPVEKVIDIYRRVSEGGVALVAVTNGDIGSWHALDFLFAEYGLKFMATFVSCEMRSCKPELFYAVRQWMHGLKLSPAQCVYIDDIESYCSAFNRLCGINTLTFDVTKDPSERLGDYFKRRGLL